MKATYLPIKITVKSIGCSEILCNMLPGPTFLSFEPEISAFSGHSSKYALGPLSLNSALMPVNRGRRKIFCPPWKNVLDVV